MYREAGVLKKQREKSSHSVLGNARYLFAELGKNDKVMAFYLALEIICGVISPFCGIYLPKLAVDLISDRVPPQQMVFTLGIFTLVIAVSCALFNFASGARNLRLNNMRHHYVLKLFVKRLHCDYFWVESPQGQTSYQQALSAAIGDSGTLSIAVRVVSLVSTTLSFLLYSGILARLHPLIVLVLIGSALINYLGFKQAVSYRDRYATPIAVADKKISYIERVTAEFPAGKDIRIYGMKPMFLCLRDMVLDSKLGLERKVAARNFISAVIANATNLLRDGLAFVYLIYQVSGGRITIGDFLLYFGAIAGFSRWVTSVINDVVNIGWASIQTNYMRDYLDRTESAAPSPAVPVPQSAPSIEFRDVCFTYEKGGHFVLDGVNLHIAPGEKIALVGINGAGKTTMIKLLCGFYKPDSGQILIDGVDIAKFNKEDLFSLFSTVFQEIMLLPLTVAENVSLQTSAQMEKARIRESLTLSGMMEIIDCLPGGIEAPMSKIIDENGVIFSGGQQHRLLLARALYKNAPIWVLDEPTAALDPIAESEIYERYHSFSQGKTCLFISHRLASTRFCDRIFLLNHGKPEEVGTHDELMKLGGKYAEMYEAQSFYYRADAKGDVFDEKG